MKQSFSSSKFLSNVAATVIDLSLVFMIMVVAARGLSAWIYPRRWVYLLVFFLSYYLVSYIWKRQTLGQKVMGLALANKKDNPLRWWQIVIREISKALLLIVVPAIFFLNETLYGMLGRRTFWLLVYIACLLIACFLVRIITKRSLWDCMVGTCKIKRDSTNKSRLIFFLFYIIGGVCLVLCLLLYNNYRNPNSETICGFKFPFKYLEYPVNKYSLECADYMRSVRQTPVEYLQFLFNQYDIVILEECSHRQQHEWEMIYELISSDDFIQNVGVIFTEYGNSMDQADIDRFINTKYDSDSSLIQAIPEVTHIMTYSYFNFLKRVNKLNSRLADSQKIRHYACDIWKTKYDFLLSNNLNDSKTVEKRDSLMAQHVIDWYNQHHKKCLVITNYRHAFAAISNWKWQNKELYQKYFANNQAQYIYNIFPQQTVNVLYFGGTSTVAPLHFAKGKWETAFRLADYQPVGFNLTNTPFGNEQFDMYTLKKKAQQKVRYQDIFTGIIFNASETRFWEEPPYPDHCLTKAAEKYYTQLLADSLIQPHQMVYGMQATELDSNRQSGPIEGFINYRKGEIPKSLFQKVFLHISLSWWHYIDILFMVVLWLFSLLIMVVYIPAQAIKGLLKKSRK